jgi:putative heme-binding domain-containing protein
VVMRIPIRFQKIPDRCNGVGRLSSRFRRGALSAFLLTLCMSAPALAQKNASIPDPDPEIERKSFQLADGFEVNLFASDPVLAKPIQMNFDARGRLWVVSSEVYPQIQPGQVANDKVLILEDADRDGRAEKTHVFADGLLIPTGVEPGDGGVYVANSTELLHLSDADGDGKADLRRVVLSGFGTEDTHHILHTLRWGHDGMLYFSQSTYIHSHIETPHGVRRLNGGGIWQFRPETMQLEIFVRGLINPWGTHFDRYGQGFSTDGAGFEGVNYLVPGAAYAWAIGVPRVFKGLNVGSPKYCGLEIASGRHLPDDWQGSLITNDFRANRVVRFIAQDDGAGFALREQPELIKTRHPAFRPIDVKMGPDGAIYIADWYNPIIQHGEVDFRDPRRDHTRGRIWRVTAKGRPLVDRPKLVDATVGELLEALKLPEDWTRHQAKRVLKERGAGDVEPELAKWIVGLDPANKEFEHHRLEGLWVYQTINVVEPKLLTAVLKSIDPRARAAATRVAGLWQDRLSDPSALLAPLVADENPRVRLEAVRALALVPLADSIEAATRVLDRPMDLFLDYGLWLTARELQPLWLPEFEAGRMNFGGDARRSTFALEATGSSAVVKALISSLKAGRLANKGETGALRLIASAGDADDLRQALDFALSNEIHAARRLDVLVEGSRSRKVRPSGDLGTIDALFTTANGRPVAARAAGVWKLESLRPQLEQLLKDTSAQQNMREAALEGLAGLGGKPSRDLFDQVAKSDASATIRQRAVIALAALDLPAASKRVVGVLKDLPANDDPSALFAAFITRRGGPAALTAVLGDQTLPPDTAKIGVREAQQAGQPHIGLVDALRKAGGLTGRAEMDDKQVQALVEEVRSTGDAGHGETVFRRADLACLRCHAIAGAGGQVGPGLESIGASAPVDYLVSSIVQPDKAIKEGFHSLVIATKDGRVVSGIKTRQTDADLTLRDADGNDVLITNKDVEAQKPGGSLMPSGLTDSLTRRELIDLVRFLSDLGKDGPYAVGQARVVRRWETSPIRLDDPDPAAHMVWSPIYSRVSGSLPVADLPARIGEAGSMRVALRFAVEVTTGGKIRLTWNSGEHLVGYFGSDVMPKDLTNAPREIERNLTPGIHYFTFYVNPSRTEPLRFELADVSGSDARAQFVLGK